MSLDPKKISYRLSNDKEMAARVLGGGNHLVFLTHGMANNWYSWTAMAREDKEDLFTYVMIDSFGYGESDDLDNYTFEELVDFLYEFTSAYLDEHNIDYASVGFGGYSMGSILTSLMSARHVDTFDYYLMMAPVFETGLAKNGTKVLKKFGQMGNGSRLFASAYKFFYFSDVYSYISAYLVSMHRFNHFALTEYAIPPKKYVDFKAHLDYSIEIADLNLNGVFEKRNRDKNHLVVIGQYDKFIDVGKLIDGSTIDLVGDVTLEVVENSGHLPLYERPVRAFEIISNYVKTSF